MKLWLNMVAKGRRNCKVLKVYIFEITTPNSPTYYIVPGYMYCKNWVQYRVHVMCTCTVVQVYVYSTAVVHVYTRVQVAGVVKWVNK